MPGMRHQRVRELIKRELGEILRRELPIDAAGVATITDVDLTPDLKSATTFVSVIGSSQQRDQALATLKRERKKIQSALAAAVALKYTPRLRFELDDSIERGNRVLQIMEELEDEGDPS